MTRALDDFRAAPVHSVRLEKAQLRYRSFGDGPAVLFLHGWPLSGITYRTLIHALAPSYRCIVPDLPGTGATPWAPHIRDSILDTAALLRDFVDQLQLDRFAIIGHDSGGGMGRVLAAEVGARVKSLVLQNTELPNHVPGLVRVLQLGARLESARGAVRWLFATAAYRRSRLGFGECFGDRTQIDGEFHEACVKPLLAGELSSQLEMLSNLDLTWTRILPDVHRRIAAPVHLFWGGADPFFPLEGARAMHATFENPGELEVVPAAKLYVHEEAPDALARFTMRHLQHAFADERLGSQPRV